MSLNIGILESSRNAAANPLLNDYPTSTIAYSLRKLRSAYTGFCITVIRSSDNTTQDIGFVNNVLDTATLLTFVGLSNGSVVKWYDQSGNGNNASAISLTNVNNPKIVISGVLVTQNGKPSVNFIGIGLGFLTQFSSLVNISLYLIGKANSTATAGPMIGELPPGGSGPIMGHIGSSYDIQCNTVSNSIKQNITAAGTATTNFEIINLYWTGSQVSTVYINNTNIPISTSSTYTTGTLTLRAIGVYGNFLQTIGYISEIVLYRLDQLTNRTGINANINSYYTIF